MAHRLSTVDYDPTSDVDLLAKIECLSRPASYPDRPLIVETIETHFAWVFLAGRFVYKLKKPLRFRDFDFTAVATRRANCELELALNRRLAPRIYVGTVPLCLNGNTLTVGPPGTPVDWLVKMHRLPRDRALDRVATAGVDDTALRQLLGVLDSFYGHAARALLTGRGYRKSLTTAVEQAAAELAIPSLAFDATRIATLATALESFTKQRADLLHARVAADRIVDCHGDLRPEHVFLVQPTPQIIDCLEFSADLRLLDTAAEISFLALECERLGHAGLAQRIISLYRECCHDSVPPELLAFYRAERAFIRAKLAASHLHETLTASAAAHWRARTDWYLDAAAASLGLREPPKLRRRHR